MDAIVKNEEEAKYQLRIEVGELLHQCVKQNPDLRDWAVKVQDCVFDALEGKKGSCAVEKEHIDNEVKHAVWRVVEKILFTTRCEDVANQEPDEKKAHIIIRDLETGILAGTSITLFFSFYLPKPVVIGTAAVGILYSVVAAVIKKFLEPLRNGEVRKRTLACLNGNMPAILSEIRKIKENLCLSFGIPNLRT